mmetsp:Transcript_28291/g.87521  ORF Transcript_28291/g.87521 Transcript_28291/m.87521 type:complete len:107 (+) Transcript_28291:1212-1532(+)
MLSMLGVRAFSAAVGGCPSILGASRCALAAQAAGTIVPRVRVREPSLHHRCCCVRTERRQRHTDSKLQRVRSAAQLGVLHPALFQAYAGLLSPRFISARISARGEE